MKTVPLRKCLATLKQYPKKDLIRVVKNNNNEVFVDITSKANGRGAYIAKTLEALEIAKKTNCLGRALEIKIPDSVYADIENIINK